jgi:hypothetical protein
MNLFVPILFAVLGASPTQSPSLDLLKRAMDPQAGLNSYTASVSLAATLRLSDYQLNASIPADIFSPPAH